MDDKEKYKQALERAKKLLATSVAYDRFTIEKIFPELRESEDERIRKAIISIVAFSPEAVFDKVSVLREDCLAWLEKQKPLPEGCVRKQVAEAKEALYTAEVETGDGGIKAVVTKEVSINFEDEESKKWILEYLYDGLRKSDEQFKGQFKAAISWLEKQGKKKATTLWHDVSEVPDEMQELLVEWESPDATWHNIAFYDAATKAFRHLKQPINNVTRWAYVNDILSQSVNKTSDKVWREDDEEV